MELDFSSESSSGPVESLDGHVARVFSELSLLSVSSHSTIYKGKRYGQWYVLKGLPQKDWGNPIFEGLLEKEFLLTIGMDHPHIAHTYNYEYIQGVGNCIVMEYVDGTTLDEYLRTSPSDSDRLRVTSQILSAMSYYHSMQIIHRDLKPKNILVTRNGNNVKVIDFGLSDSDSYAVFKQPAGSAKYMAPEQWDSSAQLDLRADIYSFGVIMRELMPSGYKLVVDRCVRENREERYSTADEVQAAILSLQKRRKSIIRIATYIIVFCSVVAANLLLSRYFASSSQPSVVHRVDTIVEKMVGTSGLSHTDTVVVERIVPLRVDTIIKEVVPPEYVEIVNKEKEEQRRKDRVRAETEKMLKYIDKEWAEYAKEKDSGRPEYLYQPNIMAMLKWQKTMLPLFDKIIELKFTNEEYYYVYVYSSSYISKYQGTPKSTSTVEERALRKTITDSLMVILEKQSEVVNSKVMVIMGGYQ